jgi:hypothetical protein
MINNLIQSPLSSVQITKYFDGKPNIRTVESLNNLKSMDELFGGVDHCVLFTAVESPTNGHWQLYMRQNGIIHFFDSYGLSPTDLLAQMIKEKQNMHGQTERLLYVLLGSSYFREKKIFYSNTQYQNFDDSNVQTCGRYVALYFILSYIYKKGKQPFDATEFKRIMVKGKKRYNVTYDEFVSMLIDDLEKRDQ